ncbi:hypothetical protein N9Y26_00440 [bacterium]|nr:hypothetical protein [bacterium]
MAGGVGEYSLKLYNTLGFYYEENNLENFDFLDFDSLASSRTSTIQQEGKRFYLDKKEYDLTLFDKGVSGKIPFS